MQPERKSHTDWSFHQWEDRPAVNRLLQSLSPAQKLEQLEIGLDQFPGNTFLHGHYGKTWYALGATTHALHHLKLAIEREHGDASIPYTLGLAYLQQGNSQEAQNWLHQAVDLAGNADHTLVLIKTLTDSGDLAKAIDTCEQGIHQHPEDVRFKCVYATTLAHAGQPEQAMIWIEANDAAVSVELAEVRYQLSNALDDKNRTTACLAEYQRRLLLSQSNYREKAAEVMQALPSSNARLALARQWEKSLELIVASQPQALPVVGMSILVRDEADIIEHNIRYHAAVGVQHFIVTDNGSVDGTREILESLQSEFSLQIVDEPSHTIDQDLWVTRMADILRESGECDWIIHNDADEFWVPANGQSLPNAIADSLNSLQKNDKQIGVLNCKRLNMLTGKEAANRPDYLFSSNVHAAIKDVPLSEGEELWNDGNSNTVARTVMDKVMTRTDGLGDIEYGNHGATHQLESEACDSVTIYHFPIRTYAQFERKVVNYGESLEKNTRFSKGSSLHLRYWYRRYLEGNLREDYEKITFDLATLQRLKSSGHVVVMPALKTFLDDGEAIAINA